MRWGSWLGSAGRATALSEKAGTHYTRADSDDANGDQQAACVVAIAVRPSSTIIVTPSAT